VKDMWNRMLASFTDEMSKIAGSVYGDSSSNVIAKPAPVATGPKAPKRMKPEVKSTNYSMVHSQQPEAAYGSATGSKSVPPPPVRT
jgi:hypothetical protein